MAGKLTTADIGRMIRGKRKKDGLTQEEVASICGVGTRFIIDLEKGKPTIQMGKVLDVLGCLGLEVRIVPRSWPERDVEPASQEQETG